MTNTLTSTPIVADTGRLTGATLSWDFTKTCNLGCGHCSNGDDRAAAGRDLDFETGVHLLAEFAAMGGAQLHMLGGEPLLRRDFLELCEVAVRLGLRVSVTTNGLRRPTDDALAWMVAHLSTITISIDGATPDLNDPIRGRGSFAGAVSSAAAYVATRDDLRRRGGATASLNCSHVLCASNVDDLSAMVGLADRIGFDSIAVSVLKEYGNALQPGAPRPPTPEQYFAALFTGAELAGGTDCTVVLYEVPARVQRALRDQRFTAVQFGGDDYCDTGDGQLRVSSDGLVHPCFAGTKHYGEVAAELPLLQIGSHPLPEIVQSTGYFADFKADANARLDQTPWDICQGCQHLHDHTCYPGCPYAPDNLKPRLCGLLARRDGSPAPTSRP